LHGSHYNRAWTVHKVISEAFERLFVKRFLAETKSKIPKELEELACDPQPKLVNATLLESLTEFFYSYNHYRQRARAGSFGKTAQFWIMYLDLMRLQTLSHSAIQENNFEMIIHGWKAFLPFYFALNKTNYAR